LHGGALLWAAPAASAVPGPEASQRQNPCQPPFSERQPSGPFPCPRRSWPPVPSRWKFSSCPQALLPERPFSCPPELSPVPPSEGGPCASAAPLFCQAPFSQPYLDFRVPFPYPGQGPTYPAFFLFPPPFSRP